MRNDSKLLVGGLLLVTSLSLTILISWNPKLKLAISPPASNADLVDVPKQSPAHPQAALGEGANIEGKRVVNLSSAPITQSGGWIEVQSRLGHGTSMLIFLPIVPVETLAAIGPIRPSAPVAESLRILLVEDQPDVRRTIAPLLKGLCYQVEDAWDGVAAPKLLRDLLEPFDLVITEVMMPKMDGIEFGQKLAELPPSLPVLFLFSYLDQAEK